MNLLEKLMNPEALMCLDLNAIDLDDAKVLLRTCFEAQIPARQG
jgi:hypothetical protein